MFASPTPAKKDKKLLIVLQYWDGDRDTVLELANLIADLERTRHPGADIMFFARNDVKNRITSSVTQRLQEKFQNVFFEVCSRIGASGYPYGPNEMFYDLTSRLMARPFFKNGYHSFINLEADCVPTRPGWITELSKAFQIAKIEDKAIIGHFFKNPAHVNGVAVYDTDIAGIVKNSLFGGPAQTAYDVHLGPKFVPVAKDVPEIFLDFQRPTIRDEDVFKARKEGVAPAIYHGVKDSSARDAVRRKYVTLESAPSEDKTVFTYFDPVEGIDSNEQKAQISLWKQAWISRGFHPIVLGWLDAAKHPSYEKFLKAIEALPTINPKKYEVSCFLRWLALDFNGGGLMTDYDLIPGRIVPHMLDEIRKNTGKIIVFEGHKAAENVEKSGNACPCMVYVDKKAVTELVDILSGYTAREEDREQGRPHVSDQTVFSNLLRDRDERIILEDIVSEYGENNWKSAKAVHFPTGATRKFSPGSSKSNIIQEFLRS